MNEQNFIKASQILCNIFSPFLLPVVGMLALLSFSYLSLLYWSEKIYILIIVILFTLLLPATLTRLYNKHQEDKANGNQQEGKAIENQQEEKAIENQQAEKAIDNAKNDGKLIPSVISILCYITCYYTLATNHVPYSIGSIVLASLMIQVLCSLINIKWNVSTHTAAAGGVTGAIVAFAEIFSFNPVWWLCVALLLAGVVGSNRIITQQHTLPQVVTGFLIGMICAIIAILFL